MKELRDDKENQAIAQDANIKPIQQDDQADEPQYASASEPNPTSSKVVVFLARAAVYRSLKNNVPRQLALCTERGGIINEQLADLYLLLFPITLPGTSEVPSTLVRYRSHIRDRC